MINVTHRRCWTGRGAGTVARMTHVEHAHARPTRTSEHQA